MQKLVEISKVGSIVILHSQFIAMGNSSKGGSVVIFHMGWLRLVGSLKIQVSFAKEPYKETYILQKRPIYMHIHISS